MGILCTGYVTTGIVASLTIEQFQAMLNFFEVALLARLCIISSCFAAGVNIEQAYRDHEAYIKRAVYSFPIILESSDDVAVGSVRKPRKTDKSPFMFNFSQFASEMQKKGPVAYIDLLKQVFTSLRTPDILIIDLNTPLFRPPRQTAFISLFRPIEITNTMAQSRKEPLKLNTLYKNFKNMFPIETPVVLLKTSIIPFTLDLTSMRIIPYFIAGLAGPVHYYISEIKTNKPIEELIVSFHKRYVPQKKFLIKKITLYNKTEFTDAVIYTEGPGAVTNMMAKEMTTNKVIHIRLRYFIPNQSVKKRAVRQRSRRV